MAVPVYIGVGDRVEGVDLVRTLGSNGLAAALAQTACREDDASRAAAVDRLRALLIAVAWFEVDRRRRQLCDLEPRAKAALVHDSADAALMGVLGHLREYRGQSRFVTWAAKFAIRETALACRLAERPHA